MGTPHRAELGLAGEALVRHWLEDQGWHCLAQRWTCRWGELDLVMTRGNTLACVEVKSRSRRGLDAGGLLALTPAKQRRLWRSAELFLVLHPRCQQAVVRFDLALVRGSALPGDGLHLETYLVGAFDGDGIE